MEYFENNENRQKRQDNYRQTQRPSNSMAKASMVVGIIGMLSSFCCVVPFLFPFSIIMGVTAIILSIMSKKGEPFTGFAIAGLIMGIFSILFGLFQFGYLMFISWLMKNNPDFINDVMQQYENMGGTTIPYQ